MIYIYFAFPTWVFKQLLTRTSSSQRPSIWTTQSWMYSRKTTLMLSRVNSEFLRVKGCTPLYIVAKQTNRTLKPFLKNTGLDVCTLAHRIPCTLAWELYPQKRTHYLSPGLNCGFEIIIKNNKHKYARNWQALTRLYTAQEWISLAN